MRRFPGIGSLLLLCALAVLMAGCGIDLGGGDEHSEPLAGLRISGTPAVGEELRVELEYSQTYPVPVEVECRLKQGKTVLQTIGSDTVPANPEGNPEATPMPGSFTFPFRVEQPGEYKVECLTPADEDNKISKTISIGP